MMIIFRSLLSPIGSPVQTFHFQSSMRGITDGTPKTPMSSPTSAEASGGLCAVSRSETP